MGIGDEDDVGSGMPDTKVARRADTEPTGAAYDPDSVASHSGDVWRFAWRGAVVHHHNLDLGRFGAGSEDRANRLRYPSAFVVGR
jgi:hypothetical protein